MRNTKQGSSGNLAWTSISDDVIRMDRFHHRRARGLDMVPRAGLSQVRGGGHGDLHELSGKSRNALLLRTPSLPAS
jgi:hypothetical protein